MTDSVNTHPGPIQRGMLKRAYEKFRVHEGRYSPRSPLRAALPLRPSFRTGLGLNDAL